jgi:nucleoside-diphosphate-sugar epimerase
VDDVVDALLAAAQGPFDGSIFQLVDPQRITQEEYAREYIRARAPHLKVTKVPRLVVDTLALGVEILAAVLRRPAPLSRYRVASALAPMVFDCSRAERGLGWKPRVGVREGLSRLLAAGRS